MNFGIELNNLRKDNDFNIGKIKPTSPIVEIFSFLAEGKDLSKFGKKADEGVAYIKALGERANAGDYSAMAEINAIRTFTIQTKLEQELKLLGFMGSYQPLGYNESIEAERKQLVGEKSRFQALNGDVTFPTWSRGKYNVPSTTISGGYIVDYRKVQFGDMSDENIGMEQVRVDIRNKAASYVLYTIYNSIKNADGVKFFSENSGIVKTELDRILTAVRRFGKASIVGDYAVVSQINGFAGYEGTSPVLNGISQVVLDEIRKTGLLGGYNGAAIVEIQNMFDESKPLPDNSSFETIFPQGYLFIIPTGMQSPIRTWTRGGLTTMTGTDVKSGKIMTRFDLEVAADVAKGEEYKLGFINDINLQGVDY